MITIFTDGSSRGNPGPGGWGSVLVQSEKSKVQSSSQVAHVFELGGGEKNTTNNRMELAAAIGGLEKAGELIKRAKKDDDVRVYSDSSYVINGITKWINGWIKNGWITKTKDDVVNKDLWLKLHDATKNKKVEWKYVGGHVGILGNERCDHIATSFADGVDVGLYHGALAGYDLPNILDISHNEADMTKKKASSSRSKAKAYSYISMVGGVIETHRTWDECKKRVDGAKGARYRKSLDRADEENIIKEFATF